MLEIAIIGCGKQAEKHIQAIQGQSADTKITLFDTNSNCAKSLATVTKTSIVTNIDDIFNNPAITAIIICTPTATHYDLIMRAIQAGKHFFCEKPLCETIEQAEKIANAVQEKKLIGAVGYVYRQVESFVALKNALDKKALGEPVTAFFRIGGRGNHQTWKHKKSTAGGALNEMGVHMIDLACWFFGGVESIQLFEHHLLRPQRVINNELCDADAEDYILFECGMKNGLKVLIQADMVTPSFSQFIEIQGTEGSFYGSIQEDKPNSLFLEKETAPYAKGINIIPKNKDNLFALQMRGFLDLLSGKNVDNFATVDDSLEILKTMDKIHAAILPLAQEKQRA